MAAVTSAASAAAARLGAALSDAQYFESSMLRVEDIRRQLDSRSIKEKLDAMKRVVALISLGKDASTFFPDVVKNVVAPSLDVKKLVYLYLVHYAEEKQDMALLAINSFQKDLSDHNQHIRALSLRVLSSIRVKVILQVVILAISRAAKDSSSYVRKAAAHAIGKVCALDVSSKELLMEPLQDLVSDRSTQVMGSAIAAFEEVCPDQYDLIHPHYRRICTSLIDVDPWGQITIVNMLLRYARIHFADPYVKGRLANGSHEKGKSVRVKDRNPDLTLLLESVAPLFFSMNNSVVASAISVYYHLATREEFSANAVKPLMRLVGIQDDGGQAVALNIAAAVAVRFPSLLIPYVSEFYVSPAHSKPIRALRMNVLTRVCASAGEEGGIGSKPHIRRAVLGELKEYLFRNDKELAASSARAIGCFATAHPGSTSAIVKVLSSVVGSASNPSVVTASIGVLRTLLQRHPGAQARALPQLIAMLLATKETEKDCIEEPAARASIIWLIGEFYEKVQVVATEALRLLARGFVDEAAEVKLQILNLAAKVVAWNESAKGVAESTTDFAAMQVPRHVALKLLEYVISCARYDRDYDVRDKARMLTYLFLSNPKKSMLKSTYEGLTSRKPIPAAPDKKADFSVSDDVLGADIMIGSLAHVMTGRRLAGFRPLEPWAIEDSESVLRDSVVGTGDGAAVNREYKGVSSADYKGFSSSVPVGGSVWEPPTGISSSSVAALPGASDTVMGVHGSVGGLNPSSNFSSDVVAVDPERFYESSEEETDEDDDGDASSGYDSEDEGEDEDVNHKHVTELRGAQKPQNISSSAPILVDAEGQAATRKGGRNVREPSSEYDLDALLGGLPEATPIAENKALPLSPVTGAVVRSSWSRIAESWKAGGLELDASFVKTVSGVGPEVSPVMMRVTNRGKGVVNNVAFTSRSGDCFSCASAIQRLNPNETREVMTNARFRGKTTGVQFSVDIDGNSVTNLEFKPSPGFVIRPHANITPGEFMGVEKSLRGMFGSESSILLSPPKHNDWMGLSRVLQEQLLEMCFVSHVKTSVGGQSEDVVERFSILFAGYLPSVQVSSSEKRPVLIRVTVKSGQKDTSCTCVIWVGCEDVLFSANLMQTCKTAVQAIDKPL